MRLRWQLAVLSVAFLVGCAAPAPTPTQMAEVRERMDKLGVPKIAPEQVCKPEKSKPPFVHYPPAALKAKTEGWALLRFELDGSGRAAAIVVENSGPNSVFNAGAIQTVQNFTFVQGEKRTGCKVVISFFLLP